MKANDLLSCPQGHRWDKPPGLNGDRVLCPQCGLEMQATEGAGSLATCPPPDTHEPVGLDDASPAMLSPQAGGHRGRFRIIKPHARGGLGQVSLARDEELGREVALKEIRAELSEHPASRQRFVNEAQITGQLEHPNIVPVYALGRDEGGRPYYAMRFVRGRTLHEAIKQYHAEPIPQGLRDLLRRFIDVCHAVAYAHSQGIIHRDLKPSNVMLGDYGETLVVDWGIAKRVAQPPSEHPQPATESGTAEPGLAAAAIADITLIGQQLGTGAYMAPEQSTNAAAAGPAADVFSLGAMLREIVSGNAIAPVGAPQRPLLKDLRPLAAAAAKALAPRAAERYGTPSELADEVERFLADEPVRAFREPLSTKLGRWARRHRPLVASTAALLLTSVAALVVSNILIARQRDAKEVALLQREAALNSEQQARIEATQHARFAEERLLDSMMASGDALSAAGRSRDARILYDQSWDLSRRLGVPEVAAIASLVRVNSQEPPALLSVEGEIGSVGAFRAHQSAINTYTTSPDGREVFTAGADGAIRQWDIRTGRLIRTFLGHTRSVERINVSPNGRLLASGSRDRTLRLWDIRTGNEVFHLTGLETHSISLKPIFSPDGTAVLYHHKFGTVGLWELPSGRLLREVKLLTQEDLDKQIFTTSIAFARDGRHLLVGRGCNLDLAETPTLWDLQTGEAVRRFQGTTGNVYDLKCLPDKRTAVSATRTSVVVWDVASGREIHSVPMDDPIQGFPILADGRTLAITTSPGQITFFDCGTGQRTREVKRAAALQHNSNQFSVLPDGTLTLAVAIGRRDSLALIDLREPSEIPSLVGHTDSVMSVAIAPDGRTAVSGSWDGTLRRWDLATARELSVMPGQGGRIWSVAMSPDGRTAVAGSDGDNTLRWWDLDERREIRRCSGHEDIVTGVAFSPDGATVASCSSDKTVRLWSAEDGEQLQVFRGHRDKVRSVAFAPDGQSILSASFDGTVRVWDIVSGAEKRAYTIARYSEADFPWQSALAVSPDGRTALSAGYAGSMAKIDLDRLHVPQAVPVHATAAWGVTFFPDGKTAVSTAEDGVLNYWDVAAGKTLGSMHLESGVGKCVAVSPDGEMLVTGGVSGTLRVIDLSRPERYREYKRQLEQARQALDQDPEDPQALSAFGDWYAFRGMWDWAIDFYEQSRIHGGHVPHLDLARCYWQADRSEEAKREFQLTLERREAPEDYLRLCIAALDRPTPATMPTADVDP